MRIDGRISVFDYALEKLVTRGLGTLARPREPHGRLTLCGMLLRSSVWCSRYWHGMAHSDAVQARHAYEAGMAPLLPQHRPAYSVIEDWVPAFDKALDELCALQIAAKQLLIEGLVRTIAHDEMLTPAEAELLRAICAVLECPLPPILPRPALVENEPACPPSTRMPPPALRREWSAATRRPDWSPAPSARATDSERRPRREWRQ